MRPAGRLSVRIGRGCGCRSLVLAVFPLPLRGRIGAPFHLRPSRVFSTTPRSASGSSSSSSSSSSHANSSSVLTAIPAERMQKSYFLSNGILDRIAGRTPSTELAPHRRRQLERQRAKEQATMTATATATATEDELFENSSSILSEVAARQESSARRVASSLLALAKPRLTVLVVLSAMASYALYPVPSFVSAATDAVGAAPSLSPLTLLFLTTGTALCSAAANALNMLYELDTDARMTRTRNRPLVRQLLSRRAALLFAAACGVAGLAALQFGVNSTVMLLGGTNIALYAGVYTPMKRLSVLNTWVGALLGGIPPLMGWAAAAGESSTGGTELRELLFAPDGSSAGGWLLAALLFAWQFPHFMALSWPIREEYRRAGLRMLCWVNPACNARVALRYSLWFVPLCVGLCAVDVTESSFAATSLPLNAWLVREAVRFWQHEGHQGSARGLFWASVWHFPAIMVLALLQKKGMWTRVWRSLFGLPEPDDDDFEDDNDYIWVGPDGKPIAEAAVAPASERAA